ncbi:MAG: biopolymer transporter ExbD [Planctomycetota bacterium]
MSDEHDPENQNDGDSDNGQTPQFGLNEPTGQFADLDNQLDDPSGGNREQGDAAPVPVVDDDIKYKNMGWKGLDDEEEEPDEEDLGVSFRDKESIPEDELDMTPMVDVTFLLLIFFMVTASFTIQKSLQQPHAKSDSPSIKNTEEEDPVDDYVQVLIDQTNTFYVTTRDVDELECPSESEMRARVKDGFEIPNVTRLIIVAHLESLHSKVVTAWDAGVVNGANQIEIQTTEEDY